MIDLFSELARGLFTLSLVIVLLIVVAVLISILFLFIHRTIKNFLEKEVTHDD